MQRLLTLLFSTLILGAQAPSTDSSAYAVAYVDVMPASKAAAVNAFKQYRDASRKVVALISRKGQKAKRRRPKRGMTNQRRP